MANTIESEWQILSKFIGIRNASDIQRTEMRKAFYSGAAAMMRLILDGSEKAVDEHDTAFMDRLHAELMAFAGDLLVESLHFHPKV